MSARRFEAAVALAAVLAAGAAFAQPAPREPLAILPGVTPISDVNQNDANGFAVLEFRQVTIEGVVQLGSGVVDPYDAAAPSTWFWVSDGTGGVAVAHSGQFRTVNAGDRVRVTSLVGTQGLAPLRGTRTLDFAFGVSDVTVVGTDPVDPPIAVTAADVAGNGASWEGTRVRVDGLTIVDPAEWPAAGASGFVRLTDGATEIRMYVDDDTDISGSSPPAAAFDVIGFVAQDDPTLPFTSNHHVYPGSLADLVAGDGSGVVTVNPASVRQGQTGIQLAFTLTGQEATLEALEIEIPAAWTWATPVAPALSGPGFLTATTGFRFENGTWILSVSGAAVTASDPGALTVSDLEAPSVVGLYAFATRTATAGGVLTPIGGTPVVDVRTDVSPGDVLINEVYPVTTASTGGREEAEFVELHNVTGLDLDIGGWTIADIGRRSSCTFDSRWGFPAGTILPADGFVVVCRTALDPQNPGNPNDDVGFRVDFPGFPPSPDVQLFETFDAEAELPRMDDPATPNMVLVDPTGEDDQFALLGGPVTNVPQCELPGLPGYGVPFAESVVLRDATGEIVDAIAYQEVGPCETDLCSGGPAGEPYRAGSPKPFHTLGRDSESADHDNSWEDLLPSSNPTPGAANVPGDTVAPALIVDPLQAGLSASMMEIRYDETVFDGDATSPSKYRVFDPISGDSTRVVEVLRDPWEPGRHYYVVTEEREAGAPGRLEARGVRDVQVGAGGVVEEGSNSTTATAAYSVPDDALAVCRVQEFDDVGFSPFVGDTVVFAGYVTVGEIPVGGPYPDRLSIWVQEPGGCGVNVFSFDLPGHVVAFGLQINDLVQVRGNVTEFVSSSSGAGAVTEVADPTVFRLLARGLDGPEPIEVSTRDANDERLEGTLVHAVGTVINSNALAAYIDDGSGSIQVFQNFSDLDLTRFTVGDRLDVTGIITQFDSSPPYFSGYELVPQNQEAIFKIDGGFASGDPTLSVQKRVLVPDLGETIRITAVSPTRSKMIVEIYDMLGRKVTTLYDGVGLGPQTFEWNGVNQWGSVVKAGAYVCHVRAVSLDGGPVRTATAPIIVGLRLNGGGP